MKNLAFILALLLTFAGVSSCKRHKTYVPSAQDTIALSACPEFVADSALSHIRKQCSFGPRVTGSAASRECGKWIADKFREYGCKVEIQEGEVLLYDGKTRLNATNIMARYNPEAEDRILLCSHWDSRPWADNDPDEANHHTPVPAANDGASGVAVMLEIARTLDIPYGIDFVCFDAEDMGTPEWDEAGREGNTWCLGSELWASWALVNHYHARYGILLDMVGGYGSTFSMEQISAQYAHPIMSSLWQLAKQLGYGSYFLNREGAAITDDHLNVISAGIPCMDIIPYFDEGPSSFGATWHTLSDTPENIDPKVLKAVGQSIIQLIYNDK